MTEHHYYFNDNAIVDVSSGRILNPQADASAHLCNFVRSSCGVEIAPGATVFDATLVLLSHERSKRNPGSSQPAPPKKPPRTQTIARIEQADGWESVVREDADDDWVHCD